jgi:hypothetical protein
LVKLRVTYTRYSDLAADVQHMAHGGMLVRDTGVADLAFEAPIELELVLPDGTSLHSAGKVLQVLAGHGVAVTVQPDVIEQARRAAAAGRDTAAAASTKREEPSRPQSEEPSRAQKMQLALHGNRDQRNAILRDRDRQLHLFVLKNPGINVDDVLAIAKNPQMGQEMFKQISERADWLQRPQIATALARNPKVPADIALRALAHVPQDVLRQFAKGTGAPPHVIQAARKRVLGK